MIPHIALSSPPHFFHNVPSIFPVLPSAVLCPIRYDHEVSHDGNGITDMSVRLHLQGSCLLYHVSCDVLLSHQIQNQVFCIYSISYCLLLCFSYALPHSSSILSFSVIVIVGISSSFASEITPSISLAISTVLNVWLPLITI